MGFIDDFKNAWKTGKQEARMEVIREFFAYTYGVKYKDVIANNKWYPSQYQELYELIRENRTTVPLREKTELLFDFLEFITEIMPRNKFDLTKIDDDTLREIVRRI